MQQVYLLLFIYTLRFGRFYLIVCYHSNDSDGKDILKESLGDSYRLIKQAALDVLDNIANKQVRVPL